MTNDLEARLAAAEAEVARVTTDRDEWKSSTIDANRRFEQAEAQVAALTARLDVVEPVVKAATEFHCVRTTTKFDSKPMRDAANNLSAALAAYYRLPAPDGGRG